MPGPKMGNTYPNSISSYPSWVAHATPYTAEWGNSVGFEFHAVEYELGVNPKGAYTDVAARLNGMPNLAGFNYFARGYYLIQTSSVGTGHRALYFDVAEHDTDGCFDLVGRRRITAKVSGYYHISWYQKIGMGSGTYPMAVYLQVKRLRDGIMYRVAEDNQIAPVSPNGTYNLSFWVSKSVYMYAGEYLEATFYNSVEAQIFVLGYPFENTIDFRLITAGPEV